MCRAAVAATAKTGEATAQLAQLQIEFERAERSKTHAEARTASLQDEVAGAMTKAARLERKVSSVKFRRAHYRVFYNCWLSSRYSPPILFGNN